MRDKFDSILPLKFHFILEDIHRIERLKTTRRNEYLRNLYNITFAIVKNSYYDLIPRLKLNVAPVPS
jgi:hypothetical protein